MCWEPRARVDRVGRDPGHVRSAGHATGGHAPAATDGFVPVTDLPPEEQLPAAPLVLSAYAIIWVAVLIYVAMLWRRLGAVQKDLDALKRLPPR